VAICFTRYGNRKRKKRKREREVAPGNTSAARKAMELVQGGGGEEKGKPPTLPLSKSGKRKEKRGRMMTLSGVYLAKEGVNPCAALVQRGKIESPAADIDDLADEERRWLP